MPEGDALKDIITKYDLPGELTGAGEIRNGFVHLHVVLGVDGDRAIAGPPESSRATDALKEAPSPGGAGLQTAGGLPSPWRILFSLEGSRQRLFDVDTRINSPSSAHRPRGTPRVR
ncbi:hypothetical protein [Streptomyces sp. NPDC020298]|uniref:hypothetical protein n=1 Tax=unclassified Streptomyces TaxID=2593676 RepID=UPI0033E41E1A